MSDTKCARVGCNATTRGLWLCAEHEHEYHLRALGGVSVIGAEPAPLKHVLAAAPLAWRAAWSVSGASLDAEKRRVTPHPGCTYCAGDGRVTALDMTEGSVETNCPYSRCDTCQTWVYPRCLSCTAKPPTLREWLGKRVVELGRWADVLRKQPVPRGWILRWESYRTGEVWALVAHGHGRSETITPTDAIYAIGTWPEDPYSSTSEALQMALFTRHPDVKPEPKPAAFPWDPYPAVV